MQVRDRNGFGAVLPRHINRVPESTREDRGLPERRRRWSAAGRTVRGRAAAPALAALLGALLAWPALDSPPAYAHAYLIRSQPHAGSSLTVSPDRLLLTFSEAVVPRFSKVRILNAGGRAMPGVGAPQAVPGHSQQMTVYIRKRLPTGLYVVDMLTLSIDGHLVGQSFEFGVGVVVPKSAHAPPVGTQQASPALLAAAAASRWLLYCGLAILAGAAGISWVSFGGAVPRGGRQVLRVGWLLAAAGCLTVLLVEERIVSAPSLLPLLRTQAGRTLGEQAVAVAVAGVVLLAFELYPHRLTLAVLGAAAAVAMLFHALSGHAGAVPDLRTLNVLGQWIHILAAGLWIGGLLWLLLGIRDMDRGRRAVAVARFSTLAGVALAVVVVTGALRAAYELGSVTGLGGTDYGVTLLVKLALVAVVAALGARNRYRLVPALAGADAAVRPFTHNSETEVTLSTAILAITAVLVGLAP